jgi:cytoskeletal protein RodZ
MGVVGNNSESNGRGPYEFALGDELRGERATLGKTLLDVQRDLRIKAAYIDAIENAAPEAFPNPSFVPGYVRSYARYLGLDPEEVYQRFCRESGFSGAKAAQAAAGVPAARAPGSGGFRPDFPLARLQPEGLADIPFPAIGSLLVLLALLAGLGYGGWMVLQNIQRVQFAPIEDLPLAVAEVDVLAAPGPAELAEPALSDLASPVAATALAELYRQQEAEVPILMPRDGPIAAIDPEKIGPLAGRGAAARLEPAAAQQGPQPAVVAPTSAPVGAGLPTALPAVAAATDAPPLTVVAERAAWIRVYLENGTILYESILERGETYSPPEGVGAPLIWAGNSGSVYVRVGEALHGPLGRGTRAVRDVVLEPKAIVDNFGVVADVPEVVSQTLGVIPTEDVGAVTIR